ncbi:hypothetical protein COCSUDRAFT_83589 [Coccomyxa subellipsoidea C-169]|uniref:Uncharacterized protein n=1 Tax=Coccomyxa subellipsoidea (strain C-169) TaxID=574566 RepID=I0Z895_COCSC|nr:hypothetical protein COCSUDRAFT_83589 [Coccomyxa subellipsoidea C-169]EIE26864.1 hypothetical protein COCSUDRAFT_83589 [Coccomyxa subellipsoidea C-169]|eukprot:XP_005651408.1 hypothetical protein COCSUDRAFT_83589 [Coccomyxa subellipsoidea C-169]
MRFCWCSKLPSIHFYIGFGQATDCGRTLASTSLVLGVLNINCLGEAPGGFSQVTAS